ncbi:hypothetical protein C8J56DRAFT_1172692 [Mycena floridula]|nr:hypothetical protein C8J56DRAFT_1172692 [Mycena floridula]
MSQSLVQNLKFGVTSRHFQFSSEACVTCDELVVGKRQYTGFHQLKGQILRWTITYLEHLQNIVSENQEKDAKKFFLDAGIKGVAQCDGDEEAVKGAASIIKGALKILIPWKREPTGRSGRLGSMAEMAMMMRFSGGMGALDGLGMPPAEDLTDMNHRFSKIQALENCPLELEMAGVRALYKIMLLPDNNIIVYYEDAKMMGKFLDIVLGHVKDQKEDEESGEEDREGWQEMAGELRDVLKACSENQYLAG